MALHLHPRFLLVTYPEFSFHHLLVASFASPSFLQIYDSINFVQLFLPILTTDFIHFFLFLHFGGFYFRSKLHRENKLTNTTRIKIPSPYRAVNTLRHSYKNQSMLYSEVTAVCSEIHAKHISTLCGQNVEFLLVRLGGIVGIAIRYGLDGPGIESWWRRDFPHLSRSALGPTQPPIQWVPSLFPRG